MKESVLNKLQKLMEHAKSAEEIGSMEEAQAFMAKVNKLLLKHNLEMSEVEGFDEENRDDSIDAERFDPFENGIPSQRKRVQWQESLASLIARYHNCSLVVSTGSNHVYFVGRKRDRQVCSYVYAYAVRSALGHCNSEYNKMYAKFYKIGEQSQMKGWVPAFFRGFHQGVNEVFAEMHQTMKAEVGEQKYAIVAVEPKKAVQEYVNRRYRGRASGLNGMSGSNEHGHKTGKNLGRSMDFGRKGVSQGGTKSLGSGS